MINTQVKKPLIPAQWYEIIKLKKVEVIAQLTARSISHNITTHIMKLKSKLYKILKQGVKSLTEQFNALIGNDWTEALQESGKTLKQFKKDLLRKFHPDLHGGSDEATIITQTINGWEYATEPTAPSFEWTPDMVEVYIQELRRRQNSPEAKRREELRKQATKYATAYAKYNQPTKRTSKVTKFSKLSKKKQRELIEQYGSIFHTYVADAPFRVLYCHSSPCPRVIKFFENLIENNKAYPYSEEYSEVNQEDYAWA